MGWREDGWLYAADFTIATGAIGDGWAEEMPLLVTDQMVAAVENGDAVLASIAAEANTNLSDLRFELDGVKLDGRKIAGSVSEGEASFEFRLGPTTLSPSDGRRLRIAWGKADATAQSASPYGDLHLRHFPQGANGVDQVSATILGSASGGLSSGAAADGPFLVASDYNGTTQYASLGTTPAGDPSRCYLMWVMPDAVGANQELFFNDGANTEQLRLHTSGTLRHASGGGAAISSLAVTAGEWQLVGFSRGLSVGSVNILLDDESENPSPSDFDAVNASDAALLVGANDGTTNFYGGLVADIHAFGGTPEPGWVTSEVTARKSPATYWTTTGVFVPPAGVARRSPRTRTVRRRSA